MEELSLDLEVTPGADLLQRVPLFKSLGWAETMAVAEITHIEKHPEGYKILEQDALGSALFLIKEGRVAVRHREQNGEVRELAVLRDPELFGEMSLLQDNLVSADVVALTPVELIVMPRKEFESVLDRNPTLAIKVYKSFCRSISDKLRKANTRLYDATQKISDYAKALGFPKGTG